MIKENVLLLIITAVLARPEPPVNQYLPPNGSDENIYTSRNINNFEPSSQSEPSFIYGPPSTTSQPNNIGQPADSYSLPNLGKNTGGINNGNMPSETYGPPNPSFPPNNQQINDGQTSQNHLFNQGSQTSPDSYEPSNTNSLVDGQQGPSRGRFHQQRINPPQNSYGPPASSVSNTGGQLQPSFGSSKESNQGGQFRSQNSQQASYGPSDGKNNLHTPASQINQQLGNQQASVSSLTDSYAQQPSQQNTPQDNYGPPPTTSSILQNNQRGQLGFDNSYHNGARTPPSGDSKIINSNEGYPSGGPLNRQNDEGYNSFGTNQQNTAFGGSKNDGGIGKIGDGTSNDVKEPTKFEFSYEVEDEPSGLKFGHSEKRDGELTSGQYNVLLPDGRKQIVQYEADGNGYRPKISYEGKENNGRQNSQSNGGNSYPNNGQQFQSLGYPSAGVGDNPLHSGGNALNNNNYSPNQTGYLSGRPLANNQLGYPSGSSLNNQASYSDNTPSMNNQLTYPSGGFSQNNQAGYPSGGPPVHNQLSLPGSVASNQVPIARSSPQIERNYSSNGPSTGIPQSGYQNGVSQNQNNGGFKQAGSPLRERTEYDSPKQNQNINDFPVFTSIGKIGYNPASGRDQFESHQNGGDGQYTSPNVRDRQTNGADGYPRQRPQQLFGNNVGSTSNYANSGNFGQGSNKNDNDNKQLSNDKGLVGGSTGYPRDVPSVRGSGY